MAGPAELASKMKEILNLKREPVGVKFIKDTDKQVLKDQYDGETKTRYCQALMRAGNGEKILITAENISCPASAAAFGLKPLAEALATGQMLYNMGLFATPEAGKNAMGSMTRLKLGEYSGVILSPLANIEIQPDVVVVESFPEHLMWLALASIYETGERLEFNSAIFQATCVDATVIPFVTGKINCSLGCFGCREATNIEDSENLLGIPYDQLDYVVKNLEKLSLKPMVRARAKQAFHSFSGCGN
ncbi:hypothetical protein MHFGQ_24350 [Moorella humiferrea]|uniref:ArCR n=2 Tax=Neomoorella humiferrea TaxID=676965 RepID=A0A2T0ARS5_9FIRM|nr:hypothetical protein MOHU_14870 [Moorella humiferrea]